jgi:hypothetical protein
VIKSNRSDRGWRGARRIAVLVSAACVLGGVYFGAAGTASAGFALCNGTVQPKEKGKPSFDAKYAFRCNADIRSFSLVTNKKFDFFGTELVVFQGPEASSQSATLQCEGPIPGSGFGCGVVNRNQAPTGVTNCGQAGQQPCTQRVSAGNTVTADLGFPRSPCAYKPGEAPLKVWLVVGTEPLVTALTGTPTQGAYTSEPFAMKIKGYNKCPGDNKGKSAKKKKS